MLIDITTSSGKMDDVIEVLFNRTAYIRQVFKTTLEDHVYVLANSDEPANLGYLIKMIKKNCGANIVKIEHHTVTEVYGNVRR